MAPPAKRDPIAHAKPDREVVQTWLPRDVMERWRKSGRVVRLSTVFEAALKRALDSLDGIPPSRR